MLDPCICQSVCLQSCLTVKAVKASTNMSNISYKSCKLLWYAKREIYTEYLCLLSQKTFLPGLPNLATQMGTLLASLKIPPEQESLL